MPTITLTLTDSEVQTAFREYAEKRGFSTGDRFRATIRVMPPDRPFDNETTEVTLSPVHLMEPIP